MILLFFAVVFSSVEKKTIQIPQKRKAMMFVELKFAILIMARAAKKLTFLMPQHFASFFVNTG